MAHHLAEVRQSMLSCRRPQPIPQDFLQALHAHQLSLRSLLPHLDPPVLSSKSHFPLQTEPAEDGDLQQYRSIDSLLKESLDDQEKSYVPKHFPDLPDKHTYQATPHYATREQDPRKVRERATEEGRLGEEALRKLVKAGTSWPMEVADPGGANFSMRAKRDQMWREAMSAITQEGSQSGEGPMDIDKGKQREGEAWPSKSMPGHLSLAVNSEKRYWRKPARRK